MFEKCGGDPSTAGHHTLRAWLVDGVTADLRFASRRPAQFLGHGLVRSPRLRLLVRGHGGLSRSTKERDDNAPLHKGRTTVSQLRPTFGGSKRPLLVYGISSGALRAALFAQRHPQLVARLALDAMVWTGEGSPTLAERKTSETLPT